MQLLTAPFWQFGVLLSILMASLMAQGKDLSLEEIQTQLLGQEVIIAGRTAPSGDRANLLTNWYYVVREGAAGFRKYGDAAAYPPSSFRGRRAIVLSVKESRGPFNQSCNGPTREFGRPITTAAELNPCLDVVVRLADDGMYLGTTDYFNNLMDGNLLLASEVDRLRNELKQALFGLEGKTLYKVGYSLLYPPNTTLADLADIRKRRESADVSIENLTPLKVLETRFLDAELIVIMWVELPDGSSRVVYGDTKDYFAEFNYQRGAAERLGLQLLDAVPGRLSTREIGAIKEAVIFRGMSAEALYYSWGYPEKIVDWEYGGKWILFSGGHNVFLEGKFVREWRSPR